LEDALSALEVVTAVASETVAVEVHSVAQTVAHHASSLVQVVVVSSVAGSTGAVGGPHPALLVGTDHTCAV